MAQKLVTGSFDFVPKEGPAPHARVQCDVALNRPGLRELTYAVPLELELLVAVGKRVAVPLGPRREVGVVVDVRRDVAASERRLKDVAKVLDEEPLIGAELLELTRWMSAYYACSWGEALSAVLPSALKRESGMRRVAMMRANDASRTALEEIETSHPKHHRLLRALVELEGAIEVRELCRRANLSTAFARTLAQKGWATIEHVAASNDPLESSRVERPRHGALSADQQRALTAIDAALEARAFTPILLQGVTGSGKTEVYLRAIERSLAAGRGAIVIVPEIALTPQTVGWFRSRFGHVAVLHSRMTDAQRRSAWLAVKKREARVVVGARSAVFAPVDDLGVVVVDEEHEPSFKQESTPRYHARDVAVMRAKNANAVCVLGSATPALETWQNAKSGRYKHLLLRERVSGGRMPSVEIVDLRLEKPDAKGPPLFSRRLQELLHETLARGEQTILFQNRRGFAPVLWCAACGETVRCVHCDISLTVHRRIRRAVCHSCCEEIAVPGACPSCTAPSLRWLGAGSERVETTVKALAPNARVARMDSDTMLRREDYERVLDRFGAGEIDVLVGTQMIAKGLDFPRVTLVGIVSADASLHQPDFRAAERTFQLLSQVSGRAGRGELRGRIVVQTSTPTHPAIQLAAKHDYDAFAAHESAMRAELGYPPFGKLVRVVLDDPEAKRVDDGARDLVAGLEPFAESGALSILGPAEAPIGLLRGRHRRHVLLKASATSVELAGARAAAAAWIASNARPRAVIDVDPVSML